MDGRVSRTALATIASAPRSATSSQPRWNALSAFARDCMEPLFEDGNSAAVREAAPTEKSSCGSPG
jgi:hypothetical protein